MQSSKLQCKTQKIITNVFLISFFLFLSLCLPRIVSGQEASKQQTFEATITTIKEQKYVDLGGKKQLYQKLMLSGKTGRFKDKTFIIENGSLPVSRVQEYYTGDEVIVTESTGPNGEKAYYISDYVRRTPLMILFGIFTLLAFAIGRFRGFSSYIGMGISFFLIFVFVLPQILVGNDPLLITLIAACFIIPITFYLSHGLNLKTTAAVLGTILALIATGIMAIIFVKTTRLTGFASEEATYIQAATGNTVNIYGLLLAGIIISVLGILDDITISQAAIATKLHEEKPTMAFSELYRKTMDIGRDHIASVVNTLVLVYTGSAMPLLLLFTNTPHPFSEVINYEIVAEEIVKMLVASSGLILAVPITTFITCYLLRRAASN